MKHAAFPVFLAVLLAGCGSSWPQGAGSSNQRGPALSASSTETSFGTRILKTFEALPAGRTPKRVLSLTGQFPPPSVPGEMPLTIVKIKAIAVSVISEAESQNTWATRWKATDDGLLRVQEVKLKGFGTRNIPALMGLLGARGYGYMGTHPTHENRYRTQVQVLRYLSTSSEEAHLTAGSPLFTLGGDMLDATTDHDQGLRVGISILSVLGEHYKDREMRKQCQSLLEHAAKQKDKAQAYNALRSGLSDLARRIKGA